MQYRLNFIVRSGIDFSVIVADFAPIYLLTRHFGLIDGWSLPELGLLYGMVSLSWGLVELSFAGFNEFGRDLIEGELDRLLMRPRSVLLQMAARRVELRRLGRALQAALVLSWAWSVLSPPLAAALWLPIALTGGVLFFLGVVTLGAAVQFWTLGQTAELQNMLTYGGSAAMSYPVSAYAAWFQRVITFGVPLAFVNYFPALAILERTEQSGWPVWLPWLSPLACAGVALVGRTLFGVGLRRYESTGS